ncbi:MAG: hypothetical protein AAGI12_00875 [Pseudomonadota bacterium]
MRIITGIFKSLLLLCFMVAAFEGVQAQTARTFGDGNIVVRLCPETCTAVNGHGFKAGEKTTVFETKDGWARVTAFLDRAKLVPSFGAGITEKPALWVPTSALASTAAAAAPKPAPAAPKRVSASSRPDKVALPSFRPGTVFDQSAQVAAPTQAPEAPTATTQVAATTLPAPTTTDRATSDPAVTEESLPEGAVRAADGTVVLRERIRVEDGKPKGAEDRKTLSWDEVQALIRKQAEEAGQQARTERIVREAKARVEVISAEEQKEQEEAIRKAAKAREAAAAAELKRIEDARIAREAAAAAAAQSASSDQAEAPAAPASNVGGVTYAPPSGENTAADATPEKTEEDVTQVAAATPAPPKVEFKAATPDPISIGPRPKTFTKALGDKRLSKLPGPKSKIRKDVVIALRHFGLTLLNSGECQGIAGGGASTTPGMLYVTCTKNPSYLHQFPLQEASW